MPEIEPRIPPLPMDTATEEQKVLLNGWWKDMHYARVLAQHPELFKAFNPLIAKVIAQTELPPRDRQVLVLRTLALCNEVYETTHHLLISRNVGMTDAEIEAARTGARTLPDFERTLVRAADELICDKSISDTTWQMLAQRYSQVQLMEVVGLVGAYTALAMIMKSFGIQLEDDETFERFQRDRHYT